MAILFVINDLFFLDLQEFTCKLFKNKNRNKINIIKQDKTTEKQKSPRRNHKSQMPTCLHTQEFRESTTLKATVYTQRTWRRPE